MKNNEIRKWDKASSPEYEAAKLNVTHQTINIVFAYKL